MLLWIFQRLGLRIKMGFLASQWPHSKLKESDESSTKKAYDVIQSSRYLAGLVYHIRRGSYVIY